MITRLAAFILLLLHAVWALDPNRAMSQYVRDRWTAENGFVRGAVYAIDQTPDGYLWIATEVGLVRFDGVTFRVMEGKSGLPPRTTVVGLGVDDEGNLWVRLPGSRLLRYAHGVLEDATEKLSMPFSNVTGLNRAADGALLISRMEDGVLRYAKRRFTMVPLTTPWARSPIISMTQAGNGDIWMGSRDAGLFRSSQGKISSVTAALPDTKINALLPDSDNRLWIGTDDGVALWNGSQIVAPGRPSETRGYQALALVRDRDKNIWAGTDSRGLLRINPSGFDPLPRQPDAAEDAITALFEDREGNLWVGTANSIERLRDSAFVTYSRTEDMPTDGNLPIFVDNSNRLWFPPAAGGVWWVLGERRGHVDLDGLGQDVVYSISGAGRDVWLGRRRGGLTRLRVEEGRTSATTWNVAQGLAQNSVYSVFAARDGTIWAGTLSAGVSRFAGGRFKTFTTADGLASNTVAAMLEEPDGTMWFATPNGLTSMESGAWRSYGAADGLPSANVNCLLSDAAGVLWAGTSNGLAFREAKRFRVVGSVPALAGEQVLGLEEDAYGWLWIATSHHVLRARRGKLIQGTAADGDIEEFGIEDGLRGLQGVKRNRSVIKDSEGRIWFSMNRGISVVDPRRLEATSPSALVQIQTVSADGNLADMMGPIRLPAGARRVTLTYAGLGLSVPGRIRYRYTLEGFDQGWSEPTSGREAVYTNLGPGHYRFRVIAANHSGAWNSREAGMEFAIQPAVWQTLWFRFAAALSMLAIAFGLYQFRLHQLTRTLNMRFEERLAERVRIAQDLHDTLLQGFLSASMQLHIAEKQLPDDSPGKPLVRRVVQLVKEVVDEGRDAVRGLRSPDSGNEELAQAFGRVSEEAGLHHNAEVRVIVEGHPRPVHPIIRDEIYRIGREALLNAFRHSNAKEVEVEMEYSPKELRVIIRDNGAGIDPEVIQSGRAGHWGVTGMRERAGQIGARIRIMSSPAAGTEVELSVPGDVAFQLGNRRQPRGWWKKLWAREESDE